jgi:hypothetical protein
MCVTHSSSAQLVRPLSDNLWETPFLLALGTESQLVRPLSDNLWETPFLLALGTESQLVRPLSDNLWETPFLLALGTEYHASMNIFGWLDSLYMVGSKYLHGVSCSGRFW